MIREYWFDIATAAAIALIFGINELVADGKQGPVFVGALVVVCLAWVIRGWIVEKPWKALSDTRERGRGRHER